MAAGDIVFFNEAREYMLDGGWGAADVIKISLATNAVVPAAATSNPTFTTFTEVATTANYVTGGTSLGAWNAFVTRSGATVTLDSTAASVSWAQHASGDTGARWGIIYNSTDGTKRALAYVDLGAAVDMSAGSLTITWNASGIAQLT